MERYYSLVLQKIFNKIKDTLTRMRERERGEGDDFVYFVYGYRAVRYTNIYTRTQNIY